MTTPAPDPGNAPPEEWTAELEPEQLELMFEDINAVAVGLPEPQHREGD